MSRCIIVTRLAWIAHRFLHTVYGEMMQNKMGVRVLKEMHQKGLGGLLQRQDGMALPSQTDAIRKLARNEIRRHLPHLSYIVYVSINVYREIMGTRRAKGNLRINKSVVFW